MTPRDQLADFIRARRDHLRPIDVGLQLGERARRVPGLRREELADLAGMSVEYLTRLEQGRVGQVSEDVLIALAGALRLDGTEREHLADLARTGRALVPRRVRREQRVQPGTQLLLQTLQHVPAFVLGPGTDVLAANRLAREVLADFDAMPPRDRNLALWLLLDPEARQRCIDWEQLARETVAILRFDSGRHPGDRRLTELVGELARRSEHVARWWADRQVLRRTSGTKRYHHPAVGELTFQYESLAIPGTDQTLCVYAVEPGTATEERLSLLASWTLASESRAASHVGPTAGAAASDGPTTIHRTGGADR